MSYLNGIKFGTTSGLACDLSVASVSLDDRPTLDGREAHLVVLTGCACGMTSAVALAASPNAATVDAIARGLRAAHGAVAR